MTNVKSKRAAVIVLLEEASNALILTKRSQQLKHHAGEICFPGGSEHGQDDNLLATGLRELEEELGIEPSRVFDLTPMEPEFTLTGFIIYPWFGKIRALNPYQIDLTEVVEVIRIPLSQALLLENYEKIFVTKQGYKVQTIRFNYEGYGVWGATARIMYKLSTNPQGVSP